MSRLILGSVVSTLFVASAAYGQGDRSRTSSQVLARALGGAPSERVVAFVADNSAPTIYSEKHRPELRRLTLSEIAALQCGAVQPGYLDAVKRANASTILPVSGPMGGLAYYIRWPACLHAQTNAPKTYAIRKNDTLTGIREKFTGAGAFDSEALRKFFGSSGVTLALAERLEPGKEIIVRKSTTATLIVPQTMSTSEFADHLKELGGSMVSVTDQVTSPGSIIGPVKFRDGASPIGSIQGTFDPCVASDNSPSYPFNASEIASAYRFTRDRIVGSVARVTVVVVDNGFFGVPCDSVECPRMSGDVVSDSSRFPKLYFDTVQFDSRSGLGPVLDGLKINPLNYWNRKPDGAYYVSADVDADSGHGTHVAGLVLGGPRFQAHRTTYLGADQKSWLTLVIANLANGRRDLLPGTDRDLANLISPIDGNKVVNMSIAFDAQPGTTIGNTIRDAIVSDDRSLYVAAAGNNGGNLDDDSLDLYPANLGGTDGNVITVASVDDSVAGVARLSKFSNRSSRHVDIAAPGCRQLSWINAERAPTEISGTSQATPSVTFAATLLSSLWQTSPATLKNRILYSGDLLDLPEDQKAIRSFAKLNIAKALTFTQDRVTFTRAGNRRTLLGALDLVQNLRCSSGASVAPQNLRALKRAGDNQVAIYRVRNTGALDICWGSFEGAAPLSFTPVYEIRDGIIGSAGPLDSPITAAETIEIVRMR